MQSSTARKLLTSRPVSAIAVRDPSKPLNIMPSSRNLSEATEPPKSTFTPMAARKTAGRKRRGKGRKTRRRHRK